MIFYNSDACQNLSDYGIDVPIHWEREKKVFAEVYNEFPDAFTWLSDDQVVPLEKKDLLKAHTEDYVNKLYSKDKLFDEMATCFELFDKDGKATRFIKENQKKSFEDLFLRLRKQCRISFMAMQKALSHGFSYHLGGGMHHAMSFSGRGFCLLNDVVIGIRKLQDVEAIKTAWVIDVDAHKGDGTSELCKGDPSIQTLSIHMAEGWPLDTEKLDADGQLNPSFIPSDVDIPINKLEEHLYLDKLEEGMLTLLQKTGRPDLVVVVQGADPFEKDELESASLLKMTAKQMLDRDKLVYNFLAEKNIPQTYVMAGGYGQKTWHIYTEFLRYALSRR